MRRHRERRRGITGPVILIGLGVLFLLHNLGMIPGIGEIISRFWPVIFILIGVDILIGIPFHRGGFIRGGHERNFSEPVNGATLSDVTIRAGINRLRISDLTDPNLLVDGEIFSGGSASLYKNLHREGDTAFLRLESHEDFFPWFNHRHFEHNWNLRLNRELPTRLKVHTGIGETEINLQNMKVTDLDLNNGVGRTTLTLPEAGKVQARIEGGVGEIYIVIPKGMAASIKANMGIGALEINGNYTYQGDLRVSPGYDTAENKVSLRIHGGIGKIIVREGN